MPRTEIKGKNWYVNEYGYIYVQGSVNSKYYRRSTGLTNSPKNIAYIKKNAHQVLLNLIVKKRKVENFESFGRKIIELGAANRSNGCQRDAISRFNTHILPFFDRFEIEKIKPMDIENWQNEMLKNYASGTVKACKSLLSQIFKKAVANDIITKNPCTYADEIEVIHRKRKIYTLKETRTIISSSSGWFKVYLAIAFTTGLRSGEIVGLKKSDFDFNKRLIKVQRSISKGVVVTTTKTKNHERIVFISPYVVEMVLDLIEKSSPHCDYLFSPNGVDPWYDSGSILKNHFKPLLKNIGVEYKELYTTRHTYLSMAYNNDVESLLLQRVAGHQEGSGITVKYYIEKELNSKATDYAHEQLDPISRMVLA